MITNYFNSFLGAIPMALALNTLVPASAAAQEKPGANAPASDKPLAFDPKNIPPDAMDAGGYTAFNTSVTKRDDEVNHSSKPHRAPNKKDQACKEDGDVCGDVSKMASTYISNWTAYLDAIKAADLGSEEANLNGQTFPISPKLAKKGEDTRFTEDMRCYLKIFEAVDTLDGTADGKALGIGLKKLLDKKSPEGSRAEAKLRHECKVDSFGDEDLARETYLTSAVPIVAGLTRIAYESRESMVQGYVPQEVLDETQGKLDQANDELGKNKKALEKAQEDIGDLQTAKAAAEAEAKKFKYATIGAGSLLALGLLIMIGLRLRKGRAQASPAPKTEPKPKTEVKPEALEPKALEPEPEPKKVKQKPEPEVPEEKDFLDDIDQALLESRNQQTPSAGAEPKPAESQPPAPESV
jgi:hypothetical protein